MGKRASARRIKANRQYTYQEAADALGVCVQTVRSWRVMGLSVLNSQKPHLILGFALKTFLNQRSESTRRKLALAEFLCMSCGAPRGAYGAMADYVPLTKARGRLEALCETCHTPCGKFASPAICARLAPSLSIEIRNRE